MASLFKALSLEDSKESEIKWFLSPCFALKQAISTLTNFARRLLGLLSKRDLRRAELPYRPNITSTSSPESRHASLSGRYLTLFLMQTAV